MKLFVGLGNPGTKYAGNRHNIGFMAVERIAGRYRFPAWRRKFDGLCTEGEVGGERVLLLKPDTFMNDSGRSVGEAARFLKIGIADIVVFHDELDLDPGRVKVKVGGGNAGHNGLRSTSAHVGNEYVRVRIGIGHPGSKDAVTHYVLGDFAKSEAGWVELMLDALAASAGWLAKGDAARFVKIGIADIVVFHDELDLDPGRVKVKVGGGNAGHNGLRSTSAHIGNDYTRVRIGIGHPGSKDAVTHYVLGDFAKSESAWVELMLDALAASAGWLAKGKSDRFQSDVARLTSVADEPPAPKPVAAKPLAPKPARHPAGERASKAQNAIAENLKKRLASKKPSGD